VGIKYKFDPEKAIEVLLYIAERCPNTYKALKILYFADKQHLDKYGRLICGDSYVAMSHGPVPSGAYDLIKYVRGDGFWLIEPAVEAFSVDDHTIIPHRKASRDFLSESDIECLDAAIEQYGRLSFGQIKARSHDNAYKAADENDIILLEAIAQTLPSGKVLLDYLQS